MGLDGYSLEVVGHLEGDYVMRVEASQMVLVPL